MIRHIILWQIKDEYDEARKAEIASGIKEALEDLDGKIPGLSRICVITEGLESSTADAMLDSEFEDEEALKEYKIHPAHAAAAETYVRPFVKTRVCMDFEPEYPQQMRPAAADAAAAAISMYGMASENGMQMAYSEGMAAGRSTLLKNMISRKLKIGKTSAQIAEDLGEDIKDIEMLIVQLLERC